MRIGGVHDWARAPTMQPMRPGIRVLSADLIERIVDEEKRVLATEGMEIPKVPI